MDIVNILAEQYAETMSEKDDALLQEVKEYTIQNHLKNHMLTNQLQGQFLQMLSILLKPKYILEIGTFTGYSALCFVKGMQKNGELHTIEIRENDAQIAQSFFNKSPYYKQIKLHIGNALDIITTLPHIWDFVYIDADKVNYSKYYDLILPKLNEKGILIADNVLFHGQVLGDQIKGKNAKAIHEFNQKIESDNTVRKVMLTIRDGLTIVVKK